MREVFDQYETIDGNNNIQEIVLKRKKRKVATKYFFSFLFFFLVCNKNFMKLAYQGIWPKEFHWQQNFK